MADKPTDPEIGQLGTGFAFLDEIEQKQGTKSRGTQPSETGAQLLKPDNGQVKNTESGEEAVVLNIEDEVLVADAQKTGTATQQSPETDADGTTFIPMVDPFAFERPAEPAVILPKDAQIIELPEPFPLTQGNSDTVLNVKSDLSPASQSNPDTRPIARSAKAPSSMIQTANGSEASETPRDQVGRQDGSPRKGILPTLPATGRPTLENMQVFGGTLEAAPPARTYLNEVKPGPSAQAAVASSVEPETGLAQLAAGQSQKPGTPSAVLSTVSPKDGTGPQLDRAVFPGDREGLDVAARVTGTPNQQMPSSGPNRAQSSEEESKSTVDLAKKPNSSRGFAPVTTSGIDTTVPLMSETPAKGTIAPDFAAFALTNIGPADRGLGEVGQSGRRENASTDRSNVLEQQPRFEVRAELGANRNAIAIPQSLVQPVSERQQQRAPALPGVQATSVSAQPEQLSTPALQLFGDPKVQVREWSANSAPAREVRQPAVVADTMKLNSLALRSDTAPLSVDLEERPKTLFMAEALPQTMRSRQTHSPTSVATAPAQTIAAAPAFPASLALGGPALLTTSETAPIKKNKTEDTAEVTQVQSTTASGTPTVPTALPVVGGPPPLNQLTPLSQVEPDTEESLLAGTHERTGTLASERTSSAPAMQTADGKLAQSIAAQLRGQLPQVQGQATEIFLDPEELGRVRMTLTGQDGSGIVVLQIERPETLDLIRRNLDQMRAELADAGWQSVDFSFGQDLSSQNGEGSPSEEGAAASSRDGATNLEAGDASAAGPPASRISQKSGLDLRL